MGINDRARIDWPDASMRKSVLFLGAVAGAAAFAPAPMSLRGSPALATSARRGACNNELRGSVLSLKAQQKTAVGGLPDLNRLGKVAQQLGQTLQYAVQDPTRAQYTTAMIARFSYFLAQGIGVALTGINQGSISAEERQKYDTDDVKTSQAASRTLDPAAVIGALTDAILSETSPAVDASAIVGMKDKPFLTSQEQRELFNKNFQSIVNLIKNDLKNIQDGKYKFPYDLELGYAPQWSPVPVLQQLNIYLDERVKVIDRMYKQDAFEVRRNFKAADSKYPKYYLQNFHYQTDGWLSQRSAIIYDYQVESLFLGMADAMRRQVVPFFTSYIKELKGQGRAESDIKILDVATGKSPN